MLFVKRKEGDVDLAAAAESGRWTPEDVAVAADHRVARHVSCRVVISAEGDENIKYLVVKRVYTCGQCCGIACTALFLTILYEL